MTRRHPGTAPPDPAADELRPPPKPARRRSAWRRSGMVLFLLFALFYAAGGVSGWRLMRLRLRRIFDPPSQSDVQRVVRDTAPAPSTNTPLTAAAQARAAGGAPASAGTMILVSVGIVGAALVVAAITGRSRS